MINWLGTRPNYPAGHCQFCGYNLHSIHGELCPECGKSRYAWVEVECEECRRVAVFAAEDAGKVTSCPFCNKAIDVPPAKLSRRPSDSIGGTRFSLVAFITASFFASLVAVVSLMLMLAISVLIFPGHQVPPILLLPLVFAGIAIGIMIGVKYSYR